MITRAQITKIASRDGVDARVVERDYVLAHVVSLISSHNVDRKLVFKGGTSLRLLHFVDYRYSADLDYSVVGGTVADGLATIRTALTNAPPDSLKSLSLAAASDHITYVGPLGAERTIKLDLTDDELVVNTEDRALLERWPDVPQIPVLAYTKLEIVAEKLRCILQRLQCRDLLDLDILLDDTDVVAAAELFRQKSRHKGLDPATFSQKFETRVRSYETRWHSELGQYLGEVPHFPEVERKVRRELRRAHLM